MEKSARNTLPQSTNNFIQPVLIIFIVIAAFFIGSLWTKVQLLEKGVSVAGAKVGSDTTGQAAGNQPQAAAGKYKTFEDAMTDFAKSVKLDTKKLITCMNSGSKKSLVGKDASQGNTLGVNGTPAFFVNGIFIGGAQDFSSFKEVIDKILEGTASADIKDYSQQLQRMADSGSFDPVPKSVDLGDAPIRGKSDAKITLVEFSDFQCPFCGRSAPTVERILKEYEGNVRVAYKHYPLGFHPRAQITAEASECAKDQGKFWEFHDQLFASQGDWSSL